MTPVVSIIMPAYNAGAFIRESVGSVLAQTYPDWELLIIDDGSTDNTAEIVKEYSKVDNRIKYFYQSNGKQGAARNTGIKQSKGEWIAFLDVDDLWFPKKLNRQIFLSKEKGTDLIFSRGVRFVNKVNEDTIPINSPVGLLKGRKALELLLIENRIPILSVLVKREALEKVNWFSTALSIQNAEDYELWLKLLMTGHSFWGDENRLVAYRMNNESATGMDKGAPMQVLNVLKSLGKEYPDFKILLQRAHKEKFIKILSSKVNWGNSALRSLLEKLAPDDFSKTGIDLCISINRYLGSRFAKKTIRLFL